MFGALASKLASKMRADGTIAAEETGLYEYGLFLLLSYAFFFVFTVIIGLILKIPAQAAVFFAVFSVLRSFAGGIHAKSEIVCMVSTAGAIVLGVTIIKIFTLFDSVVLVAILMGVSAFLLIALSPLDNPNKTLEAGEKRRCKLITVVLTSVFATLTALLLAFGKSAGFPVAICAGMTLSASLLAAGGIEALIRK